MINKFINWYFKPAKWWEFWLPQSSLIGGCILGFVISIIFILVITL